MDRLEPFSVPIENLEGRAPLSIPAWRQPPSVFATIHPQYSDYQNLKYLGRVPSGSNLKHKKPFERSMNPFSSYFGNELNSIINVAGNDYYLAVPNLDNVEFSISTFENKPPSDFSDQFHVWASEYLQALYSPICCDSVSTSEEVVSYIDLSRSPGYPANLYGFANKRQLIVDKDFHKWLESDQHLQYQPIWCVHPKEEFKLLTDLINLKIRLFTIPSYDLLYEQLRFGKKISEKLKMFKWSAYGFNPYSGGANRLAQHLLKKRVRLFYDVSGWDKYLPLMGDVFNFIRFNSDIPDHLKKNFEWMAYNTANYVFKTPSGHVFNKSYGNPSGSGTTTRDNILAHVLILASALCECYHIKFGKFPTFNLVSLQVIYLFGDDSIISLDEDFDHIISDGYMQRHFAKYGLKLKFLFGGLDYPVEQMQFLGFNFKLIDGNYYPQYDMKKLCTSVIYRNGRNDSREAFTSRIFIIMLMSFPDNDIHRMLRSAFKNWCSYLNTQNDLSPTEQTYVNMCSITDANIQQMFLGWESSECLFFFNSQWWKEATYDYSYQIF